MVLAAATTSVVLAATTSVVLAATTSVVLAAVEITVPTGGRCPFRGPPAVLGQSLSPDTIPQHTDTRALPGGADVRTPGNAVAGPVLALGRAHPATIGQPRVVPVHRPDGGAHVPHGVEVPPGTPPGRTSRAIWVMVLLMY
jgi:hypothetical protein